MKLQDKINKRFLKVTFLIFLVAGILFYLALEHVVDYNIKEMLDSRKAYTVLSFRQNPQFFDSISSPDHSIFIKRINNQREYSFYSDTLVFDQEEKELVPFRKMTFTLNKGNQSFEITILQSLLESEDLQKVIFSFMAVLFLMIFSALFLLNRWISVVVWNPFFQSLSKLNSWKIGKNQEIRFERTWVSEFDQLNGLLENMMLKIQADFANLKEFTENASHEIQTPLAIIKSKLEMVLQDKNLTDIQYQRIRVAFESAIRLSKLNEALLLLSKIENQQFLNQEEIDICSLIKSRLCFLEELFMLKKIDVSLYLNEPIIITMNPVLAEILINNLLSNALRHNVENGRLIISIVNQIITISNTGKQSQIDPSKLFFRFSKQTTSGESTGLGLAIASEICRTYDLDLKYSYSNELHNLILGEKMKT
ncbi:MAG: HAMP domain-containing sensor histidine kinase [Mariniphaga sp.]